MIDPEVVFHEDGSISIARLDSRGADMVNHPPHYTSHPSGVEVIEVTRGMTFNGGNAVKYMLRHNHKGAALEDLQKAEWYLKDQKNQDDVFLFLDGYAGAMGRVKLANMLAVEHENPTLPGLVLSALNHIMLEDLDGALNVLSQYIKTELSKE